FMTPPRVGDPLRKIYRTTIISPCDITPRRAGRANFRRMELKRAEQRFHLATPDYARLAAFRHALRRFLRFSETAAAAVGITGQHYQAMLILRASADGQRVTINELAQQLL